MSHVMSVTRETRAGGDGQRRALEWLLSKLGQPKKCPVEPDRVRLALLEAALDCI